MKPAYSPDDLDAVIARINWLIANPLKPLEQSNMKYEATWKTLPRSYRASVGNHECDVWRIFGAWRYTVMSLATGEYLASGNSDTLQDAQQGAIYAARAVY